MNRSAIILLTGTINVGDISNTKHRDADIRKSEYIDSINYYLTSTNYKIVFVENSNVNIKNYFKEFVENGRLEILTFDGNSFNSNLGKGFGELEIIEHAFYNSNIINQFVNVIKITGRYRILNIDSIIEEGKNYEHALVSSFCYDLNMMDSRIFLAPKYFFTNFLINKKHFVDESKSVFFEHILSKAAFEFLSDINNKHIQFRNIPHIKGIFGTFNKKYNSNKIYYLFRNALFKLKLFIQFKLNRN